MARRARRAASRPQGPPRTEYDRLLAAIMAKKTSSRKTLQTNRHKHFLLRSICISMDITVTEATDRAITNFLWENRDALFDLWRQTNTKGVPAWMDEEVTD